MFPLSNIYEHFPQTLEKKTSENIDYDHQNPNSSSYEDHHDQQYSTFPYSNFPAIFEDDGLLLSHLLSQQQLILAGNTSSHSSQAHTTDEISVVASNQAVLDHHYHDHDHHKPSHDENPSKLGFSKKQRAKVLQTIIPRRRTGKKDRHSKISTAQGLRDRRMRLSLQIARKFFDLQDMLGFDKASKTIEWLITKSKTAIKELKDSLAKQSCTTTSTSEGEVVSKTAEKEDSDDDDDEHNQSSIRLHKEKKIRKLHKVIARESREKARARARERTRGKILEKSRQSNSTRTTDQAANDINTSVDLGKSRPNSSTSLKKGDSTKQEIMNSSLKMVAASRFDQEPRSSDQLLDYSISNHIGVSSGANSEDDFLGFPGVIGNVEAQNPCPIFTTTLSPDAEEQKPSSFFPITTTSNPRRQYPSSNFVTASTDTHVEVNLSSVFMATSTSHCNSAAEEQNPRPVFVAAPNIVHQEQNPSSNFLMGTTNIFCNLNF